MWSDFIKNVVSFLLDADEDPDSVVETAVGLIVYGGDPTQENQLPGVGQGEYAGFTRKLVEEGVPKAICDMLFGQVRGHEQRPAQAANAYPEEVAKEYLDGVIGANIGGYIELPELDDPGSFPRNEGAGAVTLRGRPGN
jgi:hypothetical protein